VASPLSAWQNFYVIVGTASASLTGLMFVTITLIASIRGRRPADDAGEGVSAYGTPTLIHFAAALFISALLSVPWPHRWQASLLLGIAGLGGAIYLGVITRRMRQQLSYQPVLEDWIFHVLLPFVAYAGLIVGAFLLPGLPEPTLFVIGTAALLFVFIGIHNAWDTVTFLVFAYANRHQE
jgi:F0F1-type ATP synthase membrane subunit c/vacuolar-type H+-ATPase subunit K